MKCGASLLFIGNDQINPTRTLFGVVLIVEVGIALGHAHENFPGHRLLLVWSKAGSIRATASLFNGLMNKAKPPLHGTSVSAI